MRKTKKGQITLFIIIGLILLISISVITYLVSIQDKTKIEKQAITPSIPISEADPVSDFITNILKTTAKNGLKKLGDQGGYIQAGFIINPFDATESEAIQLGKNGIKIPYWWYMKSPNECQNDCEFDTKKPNLYSSRAINIEDQLKEYIEENINENLNNFNSLKEQGYIILKKSLPKIEVKIRDKDIFVSLEWEINVKKAETSYNLKEFATFIDLNIKEIYQLAEKITNKEIESTFTENAIKSLLYTFARKDKKALPPISDFDFNFGAGTYWAKSETEKKVKQMLLSYIPIMQVAGTKNFNYITAPGKVKDVEMYELLYNRYFLIPLEKKYPEFEVKFYYLDWWKPYFNLNCEGELCKPDSTAGDLGFLFGIQKYNFVYDLSVPIMVEINAPDALNGEGYSFKFALESNLRNNQPFKSEITLPPELRSERLNMFCNQNQRTSGTISIDIKDYTNNKNVEGVSIFYSCADNSCPIGTTTSEKYESKFPICINGIVSFKKTGYMPLHIPLTTDKNKKSIKLKMFPEKKLNVLGRKYEFIKEGRNWRLDTSIFYDVDKKFEETTITVIKEPSYLEENFLTIADFSKENPEINLYPGKYKATITGFNKKEITMPKDKRCIPPVNFLFIEIEPRYCYWIPDEDMIFNEQNPFPSTMTEVEFEILPEKLYNSKEIIFPYFSIAIDKVIEQNRKIEDLQQISNMKAHSESRKELLKPILR